MPARGVLSGMGQTAIDALVHLLETGNERDRRAAARCLGSFTHEPRSAADDALWRAAREDPSLAVRRRAMEALRVEVEELTRR